MNFFYLNKDIENLELKKFTGKKKFSEITIQKSPFLKMIESCFNHNFTFKIVESIEEISNSEDEIIVWNSNVLYKNQISQLLFYKKLLSSYFGIFYGSNHSYIFKGFLKELQSILNSSEEITFSNRIIKLDAEENLSIINTIWDLKKLVMQNPHTRYFNKLKIDRKKIIKESTNTEKIIREFSFLNSVPKEVQKYFIRVDALKIEGDKALYSMEKINGIDLSLKYINKGFSNYSMQNIFDELTIYFQLIKKYKGSPNHEAYSFIALKNNKRFAELESWSGFIKLDAFIKNHTSFEGIKSLFDKSNELLKKNRLKLNQSQALISHGDLCFANILMDEGECGLVFIDPRGGDNGASFRSPYYDLAKLCHSLLGGYDHIINNISEIQFNESMNVSLVFDQELDEFKEIFKSFVKNLGYEYNLVRVVEISLFLSMLPLHVDSYKKVNMLALRASELIADLENN